MRTDLIDTFRLTARFVKGEKPVKNIADCKEQMRSEGHYLMEVVLAEVIRMDSAEWADFSTDYFDKAFYRGWIICGHDRFAALVVNSETGECAVVKNEGEALTMGLVALKGTSAHVLRHSLGDCTLNGVSSKYNSLFIMQDEGNCRVIDDIYNVLIVIEQETNYGTHTKVVPLMSEILNVSVCSGGNFIYTSCSTFRGISAHPLPIHDRIENGEI